MNAPHQCNDVVPDVQHHPSPWQQYSARLLQRFTPVSEAVRSLARKVCSRVSIDRERAVRLAQDCVGTRKVEVLLRAAQEVGAIRLRHPWTALLEEVLRYKPARTQKKRKKISQEGKETWMTRTEREPALYLPVEDDRGIYEIPSLGGGYAALRQADFELEYDPSTVRFIELLIGWGRWTTAISAELTGGSVPHTLFTTADPGRWDR